MTADDQRAAIIAALKSGRSQVRVAADLGVTLFKVRRVAEEEGLTPPPDWRFVRGARKDAIRRAIKSGLKDSEICRRLHAAVETVRRVREEMTNV